MINLNSVMIGLLGKKQNKINEINKNEQIFKKAGKNAVGAREARPRCFVDEGGRIAKRFALIAKPDVE